MALQHAQQLIDALDLQPHPEGGWFKETWRAPSPAGERAAGTAIYYLLKQGEHSHWHRIDATEIWHFYAGAPLELSLSNEGTKVSIYTLGPDIVENQHPQAIVPPNCWQAARSLGPWSLVGCTVAPGFEFDGFEMAPPEWKPMAYQR